MTSRLGANQDLIPDNSEEKLNSAGLGVKSVGYVQRYAIICK